MNNTNIHNGRVTIRMAQYQVHTIALTVHSIASSSHHLDQVPDLQALVNAARYWDDNGDLLPALVMCGNSFATASGAAILGPWSGGLPSHIIARHRTDQLPSILYLVDENADAVADNLSGRVSIYGGPHHDLIRTQRMVDGRRIVEPMRYDRGWGPTNTDPILHSVTID